MKKKKLTDKELSLLSAVLEELEDSVAQPNHVSGWFANAEVFDYDDKIIDVELKFGVQDGIEDRVYTEQYQVDRKTMKVIKEPV